MALLPGSRAHGPYQAERKGGRILECTTGFPPSLLCMVRPLPQRLRVSPSGALHPERGDPPSTEPAGQVSLRSLRSTAACLSLSLTCNGQALLNKQHLVSTQVTPGAVTVQGQAGEGETQ